jgi:integrase
MEEKDGHVTNKYEYIAYFEKSADALQFLEKYNQSPVEVAKQKSKEKKHRFSEIYDMWMDELSRKPKPLSKSTLQCYQAAFKNLEPLHDMIFENLTVEDLENVALKQSSKSDSTMKNIRITLKGMYKTALRHSIVKDDLSALLILHSSNDNARPHKIFTDDEIAALWANKRDFYARLLLILIYTGMRVNELLTLKTNSVFLDKRYMIGGLKTAAGKNRKIPISEKIVPLLDLTGEYVIMFEGKKLNYSYANDKLAEYMQGIKMDHYFHDTRHTTATLLERANVPLLHRKLILGHSTSDVTDIYTHVAIERLIEDINLI